MLSLSVPPHISDSLKKYSGPSNGWLIGYSTQNSLCVLNVLASEKFVQNAPLPAICLPGWEIEEKAISSLLPGGLEILGVYLTTNIQQNQLDFLNQLKLHFTTATKKVVTLIPNSDSESTTDQAYQYFVFQEVFFYYFYADLYLDKFRIVLY